MAKKVHIDCDERYPDFFIDETVKSPTETITEEEYAFIKKACADYIKAQAILGTAVQQQYAKNRKRRRRR